MVEIGGRPMLWHIMRYYAHYGYDDFTVALGYKGNVIKRWFVDYADLGGDLEVTMRDGKVSRLGDGPMTTTGDPDDPDGSNGWAGEDWTVRLVDTGPSTGTGGRIKRLAPYIGDRGTFMVTWGDGVSNVDLRALVDFHRSHGRLATLTAARPPARFGHLEMDGDRIVEFVEKPPTAEGWINGAFFVLEPGVFDYIEGDAVDFERAPLENLALDGQLMAYRHHDFWQCMDTIRDRDQLEKLWQTTPPWRVWA
jgi:glucose-1-phosphate cytidylyltransferase